MIRVKTLEELTMPGGTTLARAKASRICRLCGKKTEGKLFSILDPSIAHIVEHCLTIHVVKTDKMPKEICKGCKCTIDNFALFRDNCKRTELCFMSTSSNDETFRSDNSIIAECELQGKDKEKDTSETCNSIAVQTEKTLCEVHELKNPKPADFVLVEEDNFIIDTEMRSGDMFLEFCTGSEMYSDQEMIKDVYKRRAVLPEMWDVYEKNTNNNIVTVKRRRYIISKHAFTCSLCRSCLNIDSKEKKSSIFEARHIGEKNNLDVCHIAQLPVDNDAISNGMQCIPEASQRKSYSCEMCRKSFLSRKGLTRHQNKFHPHDLKPMEKVAAPSGYHPYVNKELNMCKQFDGGQLICVLCKRTFTRPEHLARHHRVHTRDEDIKISLISAGSDSD